MQRVSPVSVLAALAAIFLLLLLPACGGNNTANTTVTTLIVSPTTISMNQGSVVTLSVIAENSAGTTVPADVTFSSSNSAVAGVSTGGLICAGAWDSLFINCNANLGQPGVGQVTITATSGNVTGTTTVYVHETVDLVQAVLLSNSCTSMGQTVGIYGKAFSTSAPGCSPAAPCDITSTVGPFTFGSNDSSIVTISSSTGLLTAATPGATTVFASVSGVNSIGTNYLTCPVARINVLSASNSDTTFSLSPGGTQPLTAGVYDTAGQYIQPTLTWGSSSTATATVAAGTSGNNPATVTAVFGGTAYITASCSFPNCNKYVPPQYSQNVVSVNVTGGSGAVAYAASTSSLSLVPITSHTAGTPITLPTYPNSIVVNPAGTMVYLGSKFGLMAVSVSTGAVTTYPIDGSIVAMTPDGNFILLSDSVGDAINYLDLATSTLLSSQSGTTSSSAYTPDSAANEWVSGMQLGYGYPSGLIGSLTLSFAANALDISAQGGLAYVTGNQQIAVLSTCNISPVQTLTATAPTLVTALPNGSGALAVDPPNIDVVTTPSPVSAGCPITTPSTINSYNLGAGSFTAQQLFISSNVSYAWVIPNLPEVLAFYVPTVSPSIVTLAGGATPFNGGVTSDGAHVYVGTSDNTVHRIDSSTLSDAAQIPVNLTDVNGNVTPPNLVAVVP